MNLFTGEASDAFFGSDVPPAVRTLLGQAAQAAVAPRAALLWTAQALAPDCLAIYYALYKHHAGQREFGRAEQAARRGLAEAGRQLGLPGGVDPLDLDAARVDRLDFQAPGPARFWLFTLKALAFICLRSGRPAEARALLNRLVQLGGQAGVGDEVVRGLLDATEDASGPDTPGPDTPGPSDPD